MNISKAIRVNNDTLSYWNSIMDTESKEAIKLGTEAQERLLFMRSYNIRQAIAPLPSETKD